VLTAIALAAAAALSAPAPRTASRVVAVARARIVSAARISLSRPEKSLIKGKRGLVEFE
jgi:hypothetical protein